MRLQWQQSPTRKASGEDKQTFSARNDLPCFDEKTSFATGDRGLGKSPARPQDMSDDTSVRRAARQLSDAATVGGYW
jgi:hypothetical protein